MKLTSEWLRSQGAVLSPILLFDRLLTLAQDADRAGFHAIAERVLHAAMKTLDEPRNPALPLPIA